MLTIHLKSFRKSISFNSLTIDQCLDTGDDSIKNLMYGLQQTLSLIME